LTFKYQEYIHAISNCPPSDYQPIEMTAYRFVFEENQEQSENSFLPVMIIKPHRKFNTPQQCCQGYALSLFDTQNHAEQRYNQLRKNRPNISQSLGTHLAKGSIDKTDGIASSVDQKGHFSLHEYQHTDLSQKFKIINQLEIN
jgi:hypothetical protein